MRTRIRESLPSMRYNQRRWVHAYGRQKMTAEVRRVGVLKETIGFDRDLGSVNMLYSESLRP